MVLHHLARESKRGGEKSEKAIFRKDPFQKEMHYRDTSRKGAYRVGKRECNVRKGACNVREGGCIFKRGRWIVEAGAGCVRKGAYSVETHT